MSIIRYFVTYLLAGFSFLGILKLNAQKSMEITFSEKITVFNGLSSNEITALYQDKEGFLWIGTVDGLNRYDGYRFQTFRHDPMDSTSISGNEILSLSPTPLGDLFIATRSSGLNLWHHKTNKFTRYHKNSDKGSVGNIPEDEITGMSAVVNNKLFLKTRNYIVSHDLNSNQFNSFGHYSNVFKNDFLTKYPVCVDHQNQVWFGSKDGLQILHPGDTVFERIISEDSGNGYFQEPITDMLFTSDSCLVLATLKGLRQVCIKTKAIKPCIISKSYVDNGSIFTLYQDSQNQMWCGTKNGIDVYSMDYSDVSHTVSFEMISNLNLNDQVTSIIEDRSGIFWIGTKHSGLLKMYFQPLKFKSYSLEKPFSAKIETYNTSSLFYDENNDLWLGTMGKGIYKVNQSTGVVSHVVLDLFKYNSGEDIAHCFTIDNQKNIWVGTNHGLYWVEKNTGEIKEFDYLRNNEIATLLKANPISALMSDSHNRIWIGSQFGLYCIDGDRIWSYFVDIESSNSLCNDGITSFKEGRDGIIYIGTKNGLSLFDPVKKTFKTLQNKSLDKKLLSNNYIQSIDIDNKGDLWIGTRSGLTQLTLSNLSSRFYSIGDGLNNDVINGVMCDAFDRVWVSTNKGVSVISPGGNILNFTLFDGLPGNVFNVGSVFKTKQGVLYFGGFDGVGYIDPASFTMNMIKPQNAISEIELIKKGLHFKNWLGNEDEIEYKYHRSSSLTFYFSSLEYTQQSKNRYKVMMEGIDDDWVEVGTVNHITYPSLPDGDYVFKVIGSNNDLVWNNDPDSIKIRVRPLLYMSNYAYAFYFIALVFLIQTLVNYRIRHYRKAYRSIKDKAFDKTKIEAQREILSRINKNLTDSINYAQRIQEAILPSEEMVNRIIPDSFIYYRPKDIVSGDFYYIHKNNQKLIIAAVDCTGHGVPGAFMSIVGYDLLKNIVEIQGVECPATILNKINLQLSDTFNKKTSVSIKYDEGEVNDGMDMSVCVIDLEKRIIEFAGAYSSMYLIRENEIESFEGDRFPIGHKGFGNTFDKQIIPLRKNDVIYLFSDGYADQFGGADGKKFKYRRFRHLLLNIHKLPFNDQKAILHQKMEDWMGTEYEQIDDMLLIGFKPIV